LDPAHISERYNTGKTLVFRNPENPNPWEENETEKEHGRYISVQPFLRQLGCKNHKQKRNREDVLPCNLSFRIQVAKITIHLFHFSVKILGISILRYFSYLYKTLASKKKRRKKEKGKKKNG